MQRAVHVDQPVLVDPAVQVRLLRGQEPGPAQVALPVLQVLGPVGDVEVPGEHRHPPVGSPLLDPAPERGEEPLLLGLPRRAGLAGVDVGRRDAHPPAGHLDVDLDPPALPGELRPDVGPHPDDRMTREHRHPGPPRALGRLVHDLPAGEPALAQRLPELVG